MTDQSFRLRPAHRFQVRYADRGYTFADLATQFENFGNLVKVVSLQDDRVLTDISEFRGRPLSYPEWRELNQSFAQASNGLRVDSLRMLSPLEFVVTIIESPTVYGGLALAVMRSLPGLITSYSDARVTIAQNELKRTAIAILRDRIGIHPESFSRGFLREIMNDNFGSAVDALEELDEVRELPAADDNEQE